MKENKDHFKDKAKAYEQEGRRVDNVKNIANSILNKITYKKDMVVMDFGSGTGLLTEKIAPYVDKIIAVDMSQSMNEVLESKKENFPCKLEIIEKDLSKDTLDMKFHSIISSMTIHHVEDIFELFKSFHDMLEVGGTIALADLETEDGTFHSEDTGVFHFGFDKDIFLETASKAGFKNLNIETVSVAKKPYGDFPIFLLTATKK
ncbi:MAG: class I SAM-dependent methyltransferase [Campylobacterota bacterium]|nr:class I SAM-dependent methyltransferase [Campylobacterota bacterium]